VSWCELLEIARVLTRITDVGESAPGGHSSGAFRVARLDKPK
jgi:hypothetical protein